jgi:low temperature requirement protein LtrA
MNFFGARQSYLRVRLPHEPIKVSTVELFFDLVFVFAVTQLSHYMLEHLNLTGVMQTTLMFLAVWWAWIFTTWTTNWADPDKLPVRLALFALMLAGLVLSTSIPQAFESRGLAFAAAYVFMQVGRSLFMLWLLRHHHSSNFRNFQRITAWTTFSALFWITGGIAEPEIRQGQWATALLIEFLAPAVGFWTPGLGRSATRDWSVEGGHMAERCGLFVIIALGESILVTGATFSAQEWTPLAMAAAVVAFLGSVAMWWIYFNIGAEWARRQISKSDDPGQLARLVYTYIHIVIVVGIVVCAVADESLLAHPVGGVDAWTKTVMMGGPALFLLGDMLFKRAIIGHVPPSHFVGLALLVLLIPVSFSVSPLILSTGTTVALLIAAVWETVALRSYRAEMAHI